MFRRWNRNRSRATLTAIIILGILVVGLTASASATGFSHEFVPNLLLNAASDLLGAAVVLYLVEPIIRGAVIGIRAHPHLNPRRFLQRVAQAEHTVRILDTSSKMILSDPEHDDRFRRALQSAVRRGVKVEILLMSPASDISRARARQLRNRYPALDLDRNITDTISLIREYKRELGEPDGDRIELRLYTVPTPFVLHGTDDVLVYSTVPNDVIADESPQVEVNANTLLGGYLIEGFEDLWNNSRELDALIEVRLADRPGDVPMLMRVVEHEGEVYIASHRLDRLLEPLSEDSFLLGSDNETLYQAIPVSKGAALHAELMKALRPRPQSPAGAGSDRRFYQMSRKTTGHRSGGRTEAYRNLPTRDLIELIGNADHDIHILDTSSTLLLGDTSRPPDAGTVFGTVMTALRRGARLKALLMSPGSESSRARAVEIERPDLEKEIRANLEWLAELSRQAVEYGLTLDAVQVRLYDRPPSISVYQVDDFVVTGFMPYGARTSVTQHFGSVVGDGLATFAGDQFEQLWNATSTEQIHTPSPDHLRVAVYLDTHDPDTVTGVRSALAELFATEELGLDISSGPVISSWFAGFKIRSRRFLSDAEVAKRIQKLEYALEVAALGRPMAEANDVNADAASKLLLSLTGVDNAVMAIGSLILVKTTSAEGHSSVFAKTLTVAEVRAFEANQQLMSNPQAALDHLYLLGSRGDAADFEQTVLNAPALDPSSPGVDAAG